MSCRRVKLCVPCGLEISSRAELRSTAALSACVARLFRNRSTRRQVERSVGNENEPLFEYPPMRRVHDTLRCAGRVDRRPAFTIYLYTYQLLKWNGLAKPDKSFVFYNISRPIKTPLLFSITFRVRSSFFNISLLPLRSAI